MSFAEAARDEAERQQRIEAKLDRLLAELAQLAAMRAPAQPETTMLTVKQFAARAGISQCTCRRRVSDGTIAHVRVAGSIRIPSSALRPADPGTVARLAREART
jgi:excisionase family DNA binding protein